MAAINQQKFVRDYPDYDTDVKLCAYGQNEMVKAQAEFNANGEWAGRWL